MFLDCAYRGFSVSFFTFNEMETRALWLVAPFDPTNYSAKRQRRTKDTDVCIVQTKTVYYLTDEYDPVGLRVPGYQLTDIELSV